MKKERVLLRRRAGPILWITLNRPERLNALNQDLRVALRDALADPPNDARVVIITGAGSAFCAGGDLTIMAELKRRNAPFKDFLPFLTLGEEIVRILHDYRVPTLAMVNGAAAGAGLSLALACDLRYASETAVFAMSFIRIGLHPDWGSTYHLPRLIGTARALEMAWSGEPVTASTALQYGLVHAVFSSDALRARSAERARKLAVTSPQLLREIRASVLRGASDTLETCIRRERRVQRACWDSPDSANHILSFFTRK